MTLCLETLPGTAVEEMMWQWICSKQPEEAGLRSGVGRQQGLLRVMFLEAGQKVREVHYAGPLTLQLLKIFLSKFLYKKRNYTAQRTRGISPERLLWPLKIQSEVNFVWLRNAISTHLIGKKKLEVWLYQVWESVKSPSISCALLLVYRPAQGAWKMVWCLY